VFALFLLSLLVVSHEGHNHDEEEEPENSDVLVLGDDNFESTISSNEFVFVEFYAPWCGHCKRLTPEYEIVAKTFKEEGGKVIIAKVDATKHEATGQKNSVKGFPTLKFFRNGQPLAYEGGRTSVDIIQWIKKKSGPSTVHLTSQEAFDTFSGQDGKKIIAFLSENSVSEWSSVASSGQLEDFFLAHVTNGHLFGENKVDTVVLYKPDESPVVYSGEISTQPIVSWSQIEGYPLAEDLTQTIWQRSQASQNPLLVLFVSDTEGENKELVDEVSKELKGKVLTSYSTNKQFAERWGATGKVLPTAILIRWAGDEPKLTIYDEEGTALSFKSAVDFVTQTLEDKYQSYRKSEPIPENNDGPVKIIVGKNFEEIVRDKNKDVFVEFYAPWCGHCKKLAPVWDELGQSFSHVPTVVIAKMDATANTPPSDVELAGFPTLIFFPADNKAGIVYSGNRDLDALKQYVKEHASYFPLPSDEL
jgi:protein disulfide-isomerase A1